MTRRRISLGSGLESAKLADTIQQIVYADPPLPTLTCHSPHMEHAWAHLAARIEMIADAPHVAGWSITCGVSDPRTAEALLALAERSQFSCHIQTSGPFAELASLGECAASQVADLIVNIMTEAQDIASLDEVELSLEIQS